MNSMNLPMERVPLTNAEREYLAPIIARWEAAQKEYQTVQRDIEAVVTLFRAQHKEELKDGPEWQLATDCFLRPRMDGEPPVSPNGQVSEDTFAELMQEK